MNRRLARLRAVQTLFQVDMTGVPWEEALDHSLEDDETSSDFLKKLISGTMEHQKTIDQTISTHMENWTLERIGNVDRAILRLAVFEMFYVDDIPQFVSLNEAIEIAKAFGGVESGRFVNGVLSNIINANNDASPSNRK